MNAANDRAAWIKGGNATCSVPPSVLERPIRLVLLGPPGVGKGTQAELLSKRLGSCHLSTGDVFRAAKDLDACDRSPAIEDALEMMRKGGLVSDDLVVRMVNERSGCLRCGGGFLLDGFPRTVAQAEALDQALDRTSVGLDAVIAFELPLDQIVERLGGRRTCSKCKAVYHVVGRPPRVEGVCDHCQGELITREDDQPETIRVRMATYESSTQPLIDYYAEQELLVRVPCDGAPDEILMRTLERLGDHLGMADLVTGRT